jgi:hypothetical protein
MTIIDQLRRLQVDQAQLHQILRLIEAGKERRHSRSWWEASWSKCKVLPHPKEFMAHTNLFQGFIYRTHDLRKCSHLIANLSGRSFGPVVIVNTFTSEEDALAEANSTDFGLFYMSPLLSAS